MPKCERCGRIMEMLDIGMNGKTGILQASYICINIDCVYEDVKDSEIYNL